MYCPGCGWNNKSETKFCTHCGTDLAAVAEALTGARRDRTEIDERMVRLFKDYYQGRRSVVIGGVAIALALMKLMLGSFWGLSDKFPLMFPFLTAVGVYGLLALFAGISKWTSSSSEIKAIERAASQPLPLAPERKPIQSVDAPVAASRNYSTDSILTPVSVTEQTTRQLAKHAQPTEGERNSN